MIISSETLDIGDIPPPLLLICSANQYSIEKVCVSAIQSGIMPAHCNYLSIPSNLLTLYSRAPCRTLISRGGGVQRPPLLSQFLLELEG